MDVPIGERFARAIAAKDAAALRELLAPEIDFRAMTPGTFWETDTAAQLVDGVILGQWFEPSDRIGSTRSRTSRTPRSSTVNASDIAFA